MLLSTLLLIVSCFAWSHFPPSNVSAQRLWLDGVPCASSFHLIMLDSGHQLSLPLRPSLVLLFPPMYNWWPASNWSMFWGIICKEMLMHEEVSCFFFKLLLLNKVYFTSYLWRFRVERLRPYWWIHEVAQDSTQWEAESQDSCFSFQIFEGSSTELYT